MEHKKRFFKPANDLSYLKIAELYREMENNRYEKNSDFVLPQNPKFSAFGNKIAFCQLINTWFRKNPKSQLRIYDNYFPGNEKEIKTLIKQIVFNAELHTLLTLAYGIKTKILGYSNKTVDYTNDFVEPLESKLIYDYRELTNVSAKVSFLKEYFQIHPDFFSADFFINNLPFYNKIGKYFYLKAEEPINEVTEKLFKRIESFEVQMSINWLREVQKYFYEIFDNAFQWGRNNWINEVQNQPYIESSNRIFFISTKNFTNLEKQHRERNTNLDLQVFDFLKLNSIKSEWGLDTKVLELSILDNGIGIVQTFKKINIEEQKIKITEEYEYLIEAFKFGNTSDTTARANLRGIGLNKVIQQVQNVFLIIRTGHLHLYRNFKKFPFNENEGFYLFDATDTINDRKVLLNHIQKNPWSEGTLFTFIIPLLNQ